MCVVRWLFCVLCGMCCVARCVLFGGCSAAFVVCRLLFDVRCVLCVV